MGHRVNGNTVIDHGAIRDSKRLLLIEPPFLRLYNDSYSRSRYPTGLGYIAAQVATKTDWEVKVYNADFASHAVTPSLSDLCGNGYSDYLQGLLEPETSACWDEIRMRIGEHRPSVLGISVTSQTFRSGCNVAEIAKQMDPSCLVIMGGPHASAVGAEVLSCQYVDVVVRGEGESSMLQLLAVLSSGGDLSAVEGISYRTPTAIMDNPACPFLPDLDALTSPVAVVERVLIDYLAYPVSSFGNIVAIRGCPKNCLFCGSRSIWSRVPRFRSPENVAEEMASLYEMGVRFVNFDDDTFGVCNEYIEDLCECIRRRCPQARWRCEMHVKNVTPDTLQTMKAAGCRSIAIGIESGSDEILRAIRKGITRAEALRACQMIRGNLMRLSVFFMVGVPQETMKTLSDTFDLMQQCDADEIIYSVFTPYPGTEAFQLCEQLGLIDDQWDVAMYSHQSPNNCFCTNLDRREFRMMAQTIETYVDKRNADRRRLEEAIRACRRA